MLQFDTEAADAPLSNEELSSSFLNSQVGSHVLSHLWVAPLDIFLFVLVSRVIS